jgi:hypothetical protein
VEVNLQVFLLSAVDGSKRLSLRSGNFISENNPASAEDVTPLGLNAAIHFSEFQPIILNCRDEHQIL